MDLWQRLSIHLPRKNYFIGLDLAPRYADDVVHGLTFFEIRVAAVELEVDIIFVGQAAAELEDFLQRNSGPASRADGALTPRSIDQFITIPRVQLNLLDAPCACALQSDDGGLPFEQPFILQFRESDGARFLHETFDFERIRGRVDFRNATMVADEEVSVVGKSCLYEAFL